MSVYMNISLSKDSMDKIDAVEKRLRGKLLSNITKKMADIHLEDVKYAYASSKIRGTGDLYNSIGIRKMWKRSGKVIIGIGGTRTVRRIGDNNPFNYAKAIEYGFEPHTFKARSLKSRSRLGFLRDSNPHAKIEVDRFEGVHGILHSQRVSPRKVGKMVDKEIRRIYT